MTPKPRNKWVVIWQSDEGEGMYKANVAWFDTQPEAYNFMTTMKALGHWAVLQSYEVPRSAPEIRKGPCSWYRGGKAS